MKKPFLKPSKKLASNKKLLIELKFCLFLTGILNEILNLHKWCSKNWMPTKLMNQQWVMVQKRLSPFCSSLIVDLTLLPRCCMNLHSRYGWKFLNKREKKIGKVWSILAQCGGLNNTVFTKNCLPEFYEAAAPKFGRANSQNFGGYWRSDFWIFKKSICIDPLSRSWNNSF